MIISASRRTDIPAFYATWFMNRMRAGYCDVSNPFNPSQVARVSLRPRDVDVIVFWTRNPRPLMSHLTELDDRGFRYYFLYTIMDNPRALDPGTPPWEMSIRTFQALAEKVGAEKVIWRYDPIVFTKVTGGNFHKEKYLLIARALKGFTLRSIISQVHLYKKTSRRLRTAGIEMTPCEADAFTSLMRFFAQAAGENDMEILTCSQETDLKAYGIRHGKCIDDRYLREVFGLEVTHRKDPCQRKACGCVVSKDIGMYDSCLYGCVYCYATKSLEAAKANHEKHDPTSPSLLSLARTEHLADPSMR